MLEIPVTFEEESSFDVTFAKDSEFNVEFGGVSREDYHGDYDVTPSEEVQTLYTTDKLLFQNVTVDAIPSDYVGSDVPHNDSSDLTVSGATVNVPSGLYENEASKSVASGTEGTPTATKGSASNHAISVTPSVTNVGGYIQGGTKTGTAVSVSASELVSGTYTVDSSGTKDVKNYASVSVASGTAGTPTASKGSVSNHAVTVTPSVTNTGGWIAGETKTGTGVSVSASELVSGTKSISANGTGIDVTNYQKVDVAVPSGQPNLQTKTKSYTPSETAQSENVTADSGYDGLEKVSVSVGAISSTYVGSGITRRSSSDLTASGATVTVQSGYYASQSSKSVASGTAGTPTASKGTVSNHSISVTPSVTNTSGYITGSTKTGTAVSVSASELVSGSETKTANGTYDVTNLAELVVNVSGGGGTSKNAQVVQDTTRTNASTLTAIGAEMTVSKTGTYNVYWSAVRSTTSGSYKYGTQLYIDGTAYGTENTASWSNHVQNNHLTGVSLTANQKIRVYGRNSRGTSYYIYAPTLVIVEV